MLRNSVWGRGSAIAAGLLVSVIATTVVSAAEHVGPAKVETIPGSDVKRVTLTAKAAERLDIKTVLLREEKVRRRIIVVAEVQDKGPPGTGTNSGTATMGAPEVVQASGAGERQDGIGRPIRVRILLDDDEEDDLEMDDDEDDAEVLAPDDDEDEDDGHLKAKRVVMASADGTTSDVLYFKVKSGAGLKPGQRVGVRLMEPGAETPKKVVPYSAILYDVRGDAWVYTNPDPLVFVRHRVDIENIDQDLAVLREGPDLGTKIVTVGAAELFGAELGVGH